MCADRSFLPREVRCLCVEHRWANPTSLRRLEGRALGHLGRVSPVKSVGAEVEYEQRVPFQALLGAVRTLK